MEERDYASLSLSPRVGAHYLDRMIFLTISLNRKILAFILNLEEHWFTLRRFGDANPVIDLDEGQGIWFDLNSFLKSPQWISRTYLGMLIQQLEAEGVYSVLLVHPVSNANYKDILFLL